MPILVLAEHTNDVLNRSTHSAVTAARELDNEICVLIAGHECDDVAETAARITGVSKILVADDSAYGFHSPENITELLKGMTCEYSHIVAPACANSRNILSRLAAVIDVSPVFDVVAIRDFEVFVRPIYAGNLLHTVQSKDSVKIVTVRTTAFAPADSSTSTALIATLPSTGDLGLVSVIDQKMTKSDRPELANARVVIAGGRGLKKADDFGLLEDIADLLGGAVGASRPVVDSGYVPSDCQIGQTGKIVAPELYIAVGISGAVQHLAGMKDSKVIVAINNDQDAPIFDVADYGIIGDLFEVLPEMRSELQARTK